LTEEVILARICSTGKRGRKLLMPLEWLKKRAIEMVDPMAAKHPWLGLILLVAACCTAAALGGAATAPKIDGWYATLAKPSWNPPNWIFGPVWSALYLSMAVAAWLVWRRDGLAGAAWPLGLFGGQLALNAAWSWLFFGCESPGVAFLDVLLLWAAIIATTAAFWRRSIAAGVLLLPYLAWVTFAAVLNCAVWRLNS
jgi:translocator protein